MSGRATGARDRAALALGRLAGAAARRLGRGGGTALPGLVATWLSPGVTARLAATPEAGTIVVTGTNGKTTTAHLLAAVARAAGYEPVANRSGSNLERGVVAAWLDAPPAGDRPRLGVLEVDEAALPALLPALRPRAVLFLNLFRDQLDRYGEVDSVAEGWRAMLAADGAGATLVLNADDPAVALLADEARGEVVAFGVEDRGVALPEGEHASDARFCVCGAPFRHEAIYLGHAGLWRCGGCGRARPAPDAAARDVRFGEGRTRFALDLGGERVEAELPLEGLYAVYNALGAAAAAHAIGIGADAIASALREAGPAFGRQESFALDGRELRLWLAKNPVGLNAVLRTLAPGEAAPDGEPRLRLLALLNDGVQDGRDVSWIWDADLELLAGRTASLVVAGDRAADLALRCDLAGLRADAVLRGPAGALDEALRRTPRGERLDAVATYTAMIALREAAAARAGAAPYWATQERAAQEGATQERAAPEVAAPGAAAGRAAREEASA